MQFLANFYPPPVTLCHTSRDPPKRTSDISDPRFLVGLVQKTGQKPIVQILYQLFAEGFVRGFLSGGLLSGRFCLELFLSIPLLSEYIYYNRKLNITLNFMFQMYDKKNV